MSAADTRHQVVQASRILAGEGLLDAFGHVSARHTERDDRFFMSHSLAPALVTEADVLEHDLDGVVASEPDAKLFLERFIHAEIYRRRPDVQAVVHSHSTAVLPFSVVPTVRARPIIHMCGYLHDAPPPYDNAVHAGSNSDLLISSPALGRKLAEHLGAAAVVLMRSHGFTTVGPSVPLAVSRAVYTARNCEVQQAALQLGEPIYLSDGEALACDRSVSSQADRAWNLWVHTHCSDPAALKRPV